MYLFPYHGSLIVNGQPGCTTKRRFHLAAHMRRLNCKPNILMKATALFVLTYPQTKCLQNPPVSHCVLTDLFQVSAESKDCLLVPDLSRGSDSKSTDGRRWRLVTAVSVATKHSVRPPEGFKGHG